MPRSKSPKTPRPEATAPDRAEITLEEAPIEARIRYENAEKWIAWAPDRRSIVALGDDPIEVLDAARRNGFPHAVCEWVPPVTGAIWD